MLTQQTVGRFEIRDFLGRGAIGDVFLARDPRSDREVALKVMRLHKADPAMLEAERNGVALQDQLSRVAPQVAAVFDQGQDGGFFWVAMEYVPGIDLSEVLDQGPLPEDRAVHIALQLCAMLEVCHSFSAEIGGRRVFGVVHGDIKPENIRLQDGDRVRVLDFGIAKHLSQTRQFTVNLFGSLPFTPPERLERGVVNQHSDLWAVGIVLYMMVAGRRPFPGETAEELETRIRRGEAPQPLPSSCSPRLRKIVQKCLAFDVDRRYQTAAGLKSDLRAFWNLQPLAAESGGDASATRRTAPETAGALDDSGAGLGATRRTDRTVAAGADPEAQATRRTREPEWVPPFPPPPPLPPPAVQQPAAAEVTPPAPPVRRRRRRTLVPIAFLGVLFLISQGWVRSEMKQVRSDLLNTAHPDLDGVLERYRRASRLNLLPFQGETRGELRDALVQDAGRILDSYHGDSPSTTERGWQKAHDYLAAAVDIDYDRVTRAKQIYCQAHLDRIDAQAMRGRGQRQEAAEKSRDAISGFRRAASRAPQWPDPYLGLARIYAYEQFDLEELQKALEELADRGYEPGRREKAMLADGYRMRGMEFLARAERARGTDEEGELLEQARDHLTQAIGRYDEIAGYANVNKNRADAQARLDGLLDRQWELENDWWRSDEDEG
jgi:tetratricopeptide (TPR) repeat protein